MTKNKSGVERILNSIQKATERAVEDKPSGDPLTPEEIAAGDSEKLGKVLFDDHAQS